MITWLTSSTPGGLLAVCTLHSLLLLNYSTHFRKDMSWNRISNVDQHYSWTITDVNYWILAFFFFFELPTANVFSRNIHVGICHLISYTTTGGEKQGKLLTLPLIPVAFLWIFSILFNNSFESWIIASF